MLGFDLIITVIIVKICGKVVEEKQSCLLESNLGIQDISCLPSQPTFLINQHKIKYLMKTFPYSKI